MHKALFKTAMIAALSFVSVLSTTYSPPTQAASDDECGIWLCLPTGFIQGCGGAFSAFKDRIRHFKSPLPGFNECLANGASAGEDTFSARSGYAAQISSYKVCSATRRERSAGEWGDVCIAWKTIPAKIIKGTRCSITRQKGEPTERIPARCFGTLRYTEVYKNGVKYGETHYY